MTIIMRQILAAAINYVRIIHLSKKPCLLVENTFHSKLLMLLIFIHMLAFEFTFRCLCHAQRTSPCKKFAKAL